MKLEEGPVCVFWASGPVPTIQATSPATNNVSLFSGVAFRAEIKVHTDYSKDDRVVFDKITSSVGNGYNDVTGIFTVPYNGTYDLTLTNMGRLGAININLMKNHKRLCGSYAKESHTIGEPDQLMGLLTTYPSVLVN